MARDVKEKLFEIDSKKIELDFLQQQFLVECKRFAAQSIEGKVRAAVSSNHEKAMALGKEGLKPIKNKVARIMDTVSDQVDEIMNQPSLWHHITESLVSKNFLEDQYRVTGNRGPDILEKSLKKILSPIGDLLVSHGLDSDKNWESTEGMLLYRHPLDWSREMRHCIEKYNKRFNELSKLVKEYESLCVQSSGNDALDLWDSL